MGHFGFRSIFVSLQMGLVDFGNLTRSVFEKTIEIGQEL